MKSILIFVCTLLFSGVTLAKQQSTIKGKVINEKQEAVSNASVYLMTATARGILKTALTDEKGEFVFVNYPLGKMIIEVSTVGYSKISSLDFEGKDDPILIPTIILSPKEQEIEAVSVVGELPAIQNKNGKMIMNVENSSISAGNNALEVLKRAPGVNVDKDDNISLMGQQGVNVTIDGRSTYMTGEQLASFLKSTDGSQIKSIELSTNRSAKDDAEGAAGVINIVMKKNRLEGFNGSFVVSGAHGELAKGNGAISLNYKKDNTTLFSNYSYTDNNTIEDIQINRIIPNSLANTLFAQDARFTNNDKTHAYKLGIEQKTSSRNTFMIQFNGTNNLEKQFTPGTTYMSVPNMAVDSIMISDNDNIERNRRYSFNANNEFLIDSTGKKLIADFDYSLFKTNMDMNYRYKNYLADWTLMYPSEEERSNNGVDIRILATKVDYKQSLWKGNFATGLKYSNVQSDNDILFTELEGGAWQNNLKRSNTFNYTEQIAAGYLDFSREFGKWSGQAGLRAEYTISDGKSITDRKQVKRDYLDFFPSAALSYNMNENHVFSFTYSRKVTRPNYRYLNPFEYYIDKRTFNKGNPYLNPQYTNGFGLNYTLYKMFNIAIGYDITKDAMVESIGQDNELKTTWITRENLGQQQTSYLNLTIPVRAGIWTMYNTITGIYMHFKGPIAGYSINQGSAFVQGNTSNTFKLNKQWSTELNVRYNTKFIYNAYQIQGRYNVDLGASYNFKDQRSSLKLAITDIFHSDHNNVFTNFNEYNSKIYQYRDSQTIRLTFNYRFGNLKQSLKRRDNSSEEKQRAL